MKNLSSYVHEIEWTLIPELKNALSKEDKTLFRDWKKSIGADRYWKWYIANIDEIKSYTKSTPSKRAKLKKWNSSELARAQYIVASIHFLEKALIFLDAYTLNMVIDYQDSYRGLAANAGEACSLVQEKKHKFFLC